MMSSISQEYNGFLRSLAKNKETFETLRCLINNAYIRVVNYHNTKICDIPRFEREISYFAEYFSPVTLADMDEFFKTRRWPKEKPGLIPAVFEGYRNHSEVMARILDKYGFTGWFYIPSMFIDVPVPEQIFFCATHRLRETAHDEYPDGRIALSWDEVRALSERHVICCHTGTHFPISPDTSPEDMQREIVDAKRLLERHTGKPVDVFCWLGGSEYSCNVPAQKYLKEAGYKYVVSNLKIEKIH